MSKSLATWPHCQLGPQVDSTEHQLAPTQFFHRSRTAPGSSQELPPVHVPITPSGLGEAQISPAERHYTGGKVRAAPLRPRRASHLSTPTTPPGAAPEPCPQDFARRNTVGFGQLTTEAAAGFPAAPDPWTEHFGEDGRPRTDRPFWTSPTPARQEHQPFTPAFASEDSHSALSSARVAVSAGLAHLHSGVQATTGEYLHPRQLRRTRPKEPCQGVRSADQCDTSVLNPCNAPTAQCEGGHH